MGEAVCSTMIRQKNQPPVVFAKLYSINQPSVCGITSPAAAAALILVIESGMHDATNTVPWQDTPCGELRDA
jgi:hypothetical protein